MGLILLAAPVSLGYNSLEKRLQVRWLGLSLTRGLGRARPKKKKEVPEDLTPEKRGLGPRIMGPLWRQRDLVQELLQKVLGLALEVYRTLSFRDSEATFSLIDPMWNGMLYAVVSNIQTQELDLSVNFQARNFAKIRVTVYPYRVLQKLAVFLLQFPYLRTIKLAWRLKQQSQARG